MRGWVQQVAVRLKGLCRARVFLDAYIVRTMPSVGWLLGEESNRLPVATATGDPVRQEGLGTGSRAHHAGWLGMDAVAGEGYNMTALPKYDRCIQADTKGR